MTVLQDQPARDRALGLAHWRALLEARWRERLRELIDLSVAFHEGDDEQALGHHAVLARHALAQTDEALQRLADGSFGRCEDCGARISAARLAAEPETRYCAGCVTPAAAPASSGFRDPECLLR